MPHSVNANYLHCVGNLIDYPIIPYTNAPVIATSNQFSATDRTRLERQRKDSCTHPAVDRRRQAIHLFFRPPLNDDLIHAVYFLSGILKRDGN